MTTVSVELFLLSVCLRLFLRLPFQFLAAWSGCNVNIKATYYSHCHDAYYCTSVISFRKQVRFEVACSKKGGPRWLGHGDGAGPIGLPSCFTSGLLGRMGGRRQGSLHGSFLGSMVGWVGRGDGVGLHWAPFIIGLPRDCKGRNGSAYKAEPTVMLSHTSFLGDGVGSIGIPSCFLSGIHGWMGGPRRRGGFH